MSRPWPLWRLITIAILLVIPSYLALIPTVFAPDRSRGVETAVAAHLDEVPEPDPEESDPWSYQSTDAESIDRQLKWQMGEDSTRSFDVVAEVRPDRSVLITETITQVFRSARHGIERDIPYEYGRLGERLIGFVQVATSEGTPDDLELSDVDGAIRVRIGDPDVTISNAHTYRIQYAIENLVVEKDGQALVPLDMITDWRSDIERISYRVIGPAEPYDFACYVGAYGSEEGCNEIRVTNDGVVAFENDLSSYSSFTVDVTFPLESFDATPALIERENGLIWAIIGIVMMYAALALAYVRSVRNARRDLERAVRGLNSTFTGKVSVDLPGRRGSDTNIDVIPPPPSGASSEIIPAQYASEQMPIEFVPPVNLDPACLLRVKEGVDADVRRMLAGTLVDLAADGVIGLEQSGNDWIVRRIDQPPRQVKPYEFTLLDAILGSDKNEQLLSERVSKLSLKVRDYVKQVDTYLQELGLLSVSKMPTTVQGPSATIARILGQAFIILGTSIVAFGVTFMLPRHPASVLLLAGFMSAVLILRDPMMNDGNKNRFTERGCATALRARGFDRFFRESESIHAQAAVRSGLMREYMGYAVALGSVETWVSAMPSAQIEAWTGSGFADPYLFRSLYTQRIFARSVARTFSSSSTRSGGFSGGGGGRAGGGFGGGGGGSW